MAAPRKRRTDLIAAGLAGMLAALAAAPADAAPPDATTTNSVTAMADAPDLREFRMGMPVADLPATGYDNLTCRGVEPPRPLAAWGEWRDCPADAQGHHRIGFRYDATSRDGTKVAGHPALLTLVVGEDARVHGLVIETDAKAPMFLRKKGFLLGLQAKAHYGDDGWTCASEKPEGDESPIGDTFVKEQCRKILPRRTVTVRRELYRPAGKELRAFVSRTQISIDGTE